jgi:light-regulated signal transduction histidine kinase (bacteriophytochrome)
VGDELSPERLQERLAQALRENEEFKEEMERLIYAIGHDFRQPLRNVASYAQLLQRQYASDSQTSEMTGFILDGVNEMKILIDDVLKYSRIGNSPRRTMVNLGTVVQWASLNLQNAIQETRAQIRFNDLPEALVDESQFVQLFEQLLSNSLKFRGIEAPQVEITAEEQPEAHVISVKDNCIGIEAKYLESVFLPFKRLHGKEIPGTGLGLAICKKIVRAHGGRIWAESNWQEGKAEGSVFRFTVPSA